MVDQLMKHMKPIPQLMKPGDVPTWHVGKELLPIDQTPVPVGHI